MMGKAKEMMSRVMTVTMKVFYTVMVIIMTLLFVIMDGHFVTDVRPIVRSKICYALGMEDKEEVKEDEKPMMTALNYWFK